jgi:hypothetical protein
MVRHVRGDEFVTFPQSREEETGQHYHRPQG